MRKSFPVVLAVTVLAACGDAVEPTDAAAVSSLARAVDQAGAVIVRDEVGTFFINVDAGRNRVSVHVPPGICQGAGLNIEDRMIVFTPSAVMQELFLIRDEAAGVVVLEGSSSAPLLANFCGTLNGPARIAAGTVRHLQTFTLASFAAHWTGLITGVNGEPLRLTEVYQLTADLHDPNNPALWSENAQHIILR